MAIVTEREGSALVAAVSLDLVGVWGVFWSAVVEAWVLLSALLAAR